MSYKSLTENRYTLNDIFVKKCEGWILAAFLLFPIAQIVHIFVFTFQFKEDMDVKDTLVQMFSGELPGDHFVVILYTFFPFVILFGLVGMVASVVADARSKDKPFSEFIPFAFFLIFSAFVVISTVVNKTDKRIIIGNMSVTGEGAATFLLYIFFFCMGACIRSEKSKSAVMYSILGLGLINGALTLVNEYIVSIPIVSTYPLTAIYYNINFYAYFLTILIMLSAALVLKEKNKVRRIFAFIMLCMNSYILAINNTFGCFVACFLAFIIMIIADSVIRRKFSFAALGVFAVFLAICFITSLWHESFFTQIIGLFTDLRMILLNDENADEAGTLRWGLWVNTMKLIKEKPWIGYGYEGYCPLNRAAVEQGKPHNEYLEYAAAYGLPAAISYIAGLVAVYIKAFVKRQKIDGVTFCCLVAAFGYIGSAFFGITKAYITPFFFILLGMANTIRDKKADTATPALPVDNAETEAESPAEALKDNTDPE